MAFDGGFTPRQFPIDPFGAEKPSRLPWSLDASSLPDDLLLAKQSNVLLILGEPPLDAIAPLLHSSNLAASLVILATSREYSIPSSASPAVRVLRLGVPLASSKSAASRLAAVLQWADRVAMSWRASSQPPAFEEIPEDGITAGYQTPPRRAQTLSQRTSWFGASGSSSALPSPASSDVTLSLSRNNTPPKRSNTPEPPSRASAQRAFDALFDFLPPDSPDRHLLKHAILVTTLARPFLTTTVPASPPVSPQPPKPHRFSLRGRHSAPPAPAPVPVVSATAHIVHLIPPARASLVRPLESFCLQFSFPARGALDSPRPYLMPPAALGDVLHVQQRPWTLAELVLCGVLDGERNVNGNISLRSLAKTNRAWIPGVGDIVLSGSAADHAGSRRRMSTLPYMLPTASAQPPSVLQPQPRIARPKNPQPFFAQPPEDKPADDQSRPLSRQFPQPRISTVGVAWTPRRASTSLRSSPSSSSASSSAHTRWTGSHSSHSPGGAMPKRSLSIQNAARPVSVSARPLRAVSVSSATRTSPVAPATPFPARAQTDPAGAKMAASVWPTPPSSAASSPSSSPELRATSGGQSTSVEVSAGDKKGGQEPRNETPRQSGKEVPSWDGAPPKRKRRGLFAWIKR